MKIRNLAILGGLMVAAGMATVACSGDDDDNSSPVADGGAKDTGTTNPLDAAADTGTPSAIPNHAAVLGFVDLVVNDQIVKNGGDVLSYFVPNTLPGASPSLPDIEDCLAYQFGAVLGNGDSYPPTALADGGSPLTSGYKCRASMSEVHQSLYIPGPIFDQFIADIITEATLQGLSFTTAQTNAILGLKPQIIDADASTADGGVLAYGWQLDAGSTPSDAGDAGDADAGQ
jgi:hypothetical protein